MQKPVMMMVMIMIMTMMLVASVVRRDQPWSNGCRIVYINEYLINDGSDAMIQPRVWLSRSRLRIDT